MTNDSKIMFDNYRKIEEFNPVSNKFFNDDMIDL